MKKALKLGLHSVLALIKDGVMPAQIVKKYNIPKQSLSYHVGKLKALGCIEKKAYGTWDYIMDVPKVPIRPKGSLIGQPKKEIRGHAFIWKIEFDQPFNWDIVVGKYSKKKLTFQKIARGKVHRTILDNRKIWLTKKGLVIYEPLDFFGKSSFETKGTAVYQMDKLIKRLLRELGLKFRPYRFTTSREHYGIIKHELAKQFNERKEKLHIRQEDGSIWLWIDDSLSLGELETKDPVINRQLQNYWNDHRKTKFEITPSFILNGFNQNNLAIQGITENQLIFDKNMSSHLKVLDKIGKAVGKLTDTIKEIKGGKN